MSENTSIMQSKLQSAVDDFLWDHQLNNLTPSKNDLLFQKCALSIDLIKSTELFLNNAIILAEDSNEEKDVVVRLLVELRKKAHDYIPVVTEDLEGLKESIISLSSEIITVLKEITQDSENLNELSRMMTDVFESIIKIFDYH